MQTVLKKKQISLKATVLSLFFIVTAILSAIFILQLLFYSQKLSFESIDVKVQSLVQTSKESLENQEAINRNIVNFLSITNSNHKQLYTQILEHNPNLYAVYTGYSDGGFYEIINFDIHESLREIYGASSEDRWLLILIDGSTTEQKKIAFLDKNLDQTAQRFEPNEYDPRLRPWYKAAKETKEVIKTQPYQFSNIPSKGITYAKQVDNGDATVAIDVLLYDVEALFAKAIDNDYTSAFLFNNQKVVISSYGQKNLLHRFFALQESFENFATPKTIVIDGVKYIAEIQSLKTNNGEYIAVFAKYKDVVRPYHEQMYLLFGIFLASALLVIPFVIYLSQIIVKPIYKLIAQSKKVRKREFNKVKYVNTPVLEVSELSNAMLTMSQAIFSYQTSLEKKVRQRTKELDEKNKELLQLSITDKLTGLYNRVKLDQVIEEQFELAKRYNMPFSIVILDIDHFKQVNDMYGHKIGDDVLMELAEILQENVRKTDILGRWGGEEFLLICPQSDQDEAKTVAQKINIAVGQAKFSTYEKQVTISVGVCGYKAGLDIENMLIFADEALYRAKKNGRNRVEVNA